MMLSAARLTPRMVTVTVFILLLFAVVVDAHEAVREQDVDAGSSSSLRFLLDRRTTRSSTTTQTKTGDVGARRLATTTTSSCTRNLTIRAAVKISEPLAYTYIENQNRTNSSTSSSHDNSNSGTTDSALQDRAITVTFAGLQLDLLEQIKGFALQDDGIHLSFDLEMLPEGYGSYDQALNLVANDCKESEDHRQELANASLCSRYDMILGDYWPSAERYQRVDFTPAWLRSSMSAVKYIHSTKYAQVTTFAQAVQGSHRICAETNSLVPRVVRRLFPQADILECGPNNTACFPFLKNESCALLAADDLQVRFLSLHDHTLEVTKEQLNTKSIVWPMRRGMLLRNSSSSADAVGSQESDRNCTMDLTEQMDDPAELISKWIYQASDNALLDDLKFNYYHASLCPLGKAGTACDQPCDAEHGASDRMGVCICESTRWTGPDCGTDVVTNLNLIESPLLIMGYTMFGINMAVCIACFVWIIRYRTSSQVKTSQPFFLWLVLLGSMVSSSTIVALSQQHSGSDPLPACIAIPWTYSIGFCITFGTLYAKLRRVQVLFRRAASFRRTVVTAKETLFIIAIILAVDVTLLTVWTIVDPLEWQRRVIVTDKHGYVLESQGFCWSQHWPAFAGALCGLHFVLLLFASYLSYRSRHISTDFSESKYVALAMISNFQIYLVGVPVLFLVGTDPDSAYFVRTVIIWMNDFVVVALIFGNLMYSVHKMGISHRGDVNERGGTGSGDHSRIQSAISKYCEAEAKSRRGSFLRGNNSTTANMAVNAEPD